MNKKRESKGKLKSPKNGATCKVPGPGRPKGSPNKLSATAKENIEKVYNGLGGITAHITFLKKYPKHLADFYKDVYPKLLAINVQGELNLCGDVLIKVISALPRAKENVKK